MWDISIDVLKHAEMVQQVLLLSRGRLLAPVAGDLLINDGEFACRDAASSKSLLEEDIETSTFLN